MSNENLCPITKMKGFRIYATPRGVLGAVRRLFKNHPERFITGNECVGRTRYGNVGATTPAKAEKVCALGAIFVYSGLKRASMTYKKLPSQVALEATMLLAEGAKGPHPERTFKGARYAVYGVNDHGERGRENIIEAIDRVLGKEKRHA